jgi:polyhydroxybutyrate depolymerase
MQASTLAISPQAVFRTVADREGFIVVFPDGLSNQWNDCRSDAPGIVGAGDDVAFFDALLTRLQGEFGLDSRHVFLSGTSNGAMMSMRYALERAERIGGIAVSSGSLAAMPKSGRCTDGPSRAVPILMTHGAIDPLVLYNGGCVAQPITGNCSQGTVIGAEATRDRWIAYNSLTGVFPQTARIDIATDDNGSVANQFRYLGTVPVEWWRLDGAGHNPPSRTVYLERLFSGQQNHDIEFAEVAWTFMAARLP